MGELLGFEAFHAAAYRRVVGQVFAFLGDLQEAEDVTQDAFAKASFHWQRIAAYDQPEAWVRRVAFNEAHNSTRRARRWLGALSRHGPPAHVPAVSPDRVDLHRALRRLAPRHREVLVLHYVAELSVDEPGVGEIHRRARRHYRRVAALTVTAVLLAGGAAVGIGLRASSVPTVNRPRPPVTVAPQKVAPPESFVTVVHGGAGADSGELAVVSTATGEEIRSLAPATSPDFAVTQDRSWVYFHSSSPSQGIYRVPLAGGTVEKVADSAESTELTVSPDGSKLVWGMRSGNRPALRVRDLARASDRVLPIPGPLSGPKIISRGKWAWSPDSRQLAVLVVHGISRGYTELMTVDVVTGKWRHRLDFAEHGGGSKCCGAMAWPAGSGRIAVVQTAYGGGGMVQASRLVYVDPTTGATAPGPVLAGRNQLLGSQLDFDPSGRYVLFGLQDTHSVSTWWSKGGKPVRVAQIEIGDKAPADVAGAYVGGAW